MINHFLMQFAAVRESELDIPTGELNGASFRSILQVVFALAAATALIVLLLAALKYITSRGDPQGVAKAKNTIIYAVIGLVVAASAFAIVSFVVKSV